MTRPDFIDLLDKQHILNVDVEHTIRPGSRLMLQVFRAAVEEEGFQETLDSVRARCVALTFSTYANRFLGSTRSRRCTARTSSRSRRTRST